ncbi:MAG: hypothetical protein V1724_10265 [Chloroflexota bacterium]
MSSEDWQGAIRNLKKPAPQAVDLSPRSPFDALLDQRLKGLEHQVEELKGRLYGLMFLVAGAVVVQIVLSFFK